MEVPAVTTKETTVKRVLLTTLLTVTALIVAVPAHADLPGQPNGIPEQANSEQWRFAAGNVCIEDRTGGAWGDGLRFAAERYSQSSDINVSYRDTIADCATAGFPVSQIVIAEKTIGACPGPTANAYVWTQGGWLVRGYTIAHSAVKIHRGCTWYWDNLTPTELVLAQRSSAAHELGHVFGFAHQTAPPCTLPYDGAWWLCRQDTVMAAGWYVNGGYVALSPWDYWRLDVIYPW
jgi:hypothetical protein